ncbi:hypothetical protein CRI94_07130 [Longibacter salinarum]|uniref:Uncharacterized protein n=1 Tax=Longibacter salinarum TaxID=1850348 RepID=A0A2A8CYL6_9BACT|nr:hypothetical protein [Longibacter salinarum]PEN13829.1 hypothetical protein CRI94_07130 [Longibacter salinarum]
MPLPLEVLADLTLAIDGEDIQIQGDGDVVVVDLPSIRAGKRLLQAGPWSGDVRRMRTEQFNQALRTAGVTINVQYKGETIARLGETASPNAVAHLLDFGEVELHPVKALQAEARSRPLATLAVVGGASAVLAYIISRLRK